MNCDSCNVRVNSNGFLSGSIVCCTCAELKRKGKTDALDKRKAKYGGSK